jgi:hypothetical protein
MILITHLVTDQLLVFFFLFEHLQSKITTDETLTWSYFNLQKSECTEKLKSKISGLIN